MRGTCCAGLRLLLLPAALLGAGAAAAENPPSAAAEAGLPATMIVLDASSSMNAKIGGASKISSVRTELGQALGSYAGRLSFGLVAFGHRKASNCADSEVLAKPGELTFATQGKLLDQIKPKGQSPVAAAISDAAKAAPTQGSFDIVLIADGGDSCDADICATAAALKEKSPALRIHVIGFADKVDDIKPLSCLAQATGGTFAVATNSGELKQGLASILDTVAAPGSPPPQAVAAETGPSRAGAGVAAGGGGDRAAHRPGGPGRGRCASSSRGRSGRRGAAARRDRHQAHRSQHQVRQTGCLPGSAGGGASGPRDGGT